MGFEVITERLRMEPFQPQHLEGLFAMDGDPEVMRFIGDGKPRTRAETQAAIERVQGRWALFGFSWWALMSRADGAVLGSACVQHLAHEEAAPLEIGWRLRRDAWGQGFASEAARAAVAFAFTRVGVDHVIAVAHPDNRASIRVMERLGMRDLGIEQHYGQSCATYRLDRATGQAAGRPSQSAPSL
ncbi:N-acetyltransferase [Pseudorhodobacter sp. E13]|uniref:GNAT family N-acetyltransferase n=1 Tax=Pseudorhodobacter sp. E13 TaxID=2487931 RepID=UPI000F8ED66A|nr:GNAT family N-acetyltransferase [Pseudorhodobacter sp. E13]RUS64928.1 N-acetyltransferase [Pseudorhodobacter sp. E13]